MTHNELNAQIREICKDLIIDGCKKSHLCKVLLGQHNQPMFENFLNKDKNFGISVLTRMVENFDYELVLMPINRNQQDPEVQRLIGLNDTKFVEQFKNIVRESTETIQLHNNARPSKHINDTASELLERILSGEMNEE